MKYLLLGLTMIFASIAFACLGILCALVPETVIKDKGILLIACVAFSILFIIIGFIISISSMYLKEEKQGDKKENI